MNGDGFSLIAVVVEVAGDAIAAPQELAKKPSYVVLNCSSIQEGASFLDLMRRRSAVTSDEPTPNKAFDPVEWELIRADIAMEKARLKTNGDWSKWERFQTETNATVLRPLIEWGAARARRPALGSSPAGRFATCASGSG